MSFGKSLSSIAAREAARPFHLDGIPVNLDKSKPAVLLVRHAGASNKAYENGKFRALNARRARGLLATATAEAEAERRLVYAKLFAQHVIIGWENVCEDEAPLEPAVFSPAKCEEMLIALVENRPDIYDYLFAFAIDADNFRDQPLTDTETLGK